MSNMLYMIPSWAEWSATENSEPWSASTAQLVNHEIAWKSSLVKPISEKHLLSAGCQLAVRHHIMILQMKRKMKIATYEDDKHKTEHEISIDYLYKFSTGKDDGNMSR